MRMGRVFPVFALLALVSCDCVSAVFNAITQESPVTVEARNTAIFTYRTSTPYALMEVRLILIKGGNYSIINIFRDGRDQQRCDLPEYVGRTELVREGLARGSATLKLLNVSIADEGTYRCFLKTDDYFDFCDLELKVTALGSSPKITLEGLQDGGIKAVCMSAGWYPKPTLVDIDDDGEMEIRKEENGFYSIRYSRVITENSNRSFSCRLWTPYLSQELEASVYVADGLFRKSTDVFTILFAISLVLFLATGAILCACQRHKLGVSKFSLPFSTRLAKSKKPQPCDQRSACVCSTGKLSAASKIRMDHVLLVLTCFILTCSNCISAQFTALTQVSPVVVAVGDVAVFTCRTSVIRDLVEVRWFRTHADRLINLFQDGRDQQRCDLPEYVGRTGLVRDGLARGSASLKLFNVSVADEGTYRCYLETEHYFDIGDLVLRVTALGSDPRIDLEGFLDGGIKAVCRSEGWYPEPTLVNKDNDGNLMIRQEEKGLFSITYSKVITENSSRTFSCTIQTLDPHQEQGLSLYITDSLFQRTTDCMATTIFYPLMAVKLILFVAAVTLVTYTLRRKKQGASSAANTEERLLNAV